jgi:alanyl-tRNA synthetase
MHFDLRPDEGKVSAETLDTDRFVELWNLVFIQYNRLSGTQLDPLPAKHVDTGMGFERLVSVLQGVDSNYKTDLFTKSLNVLRSLTGASEAEMLKDFTPYRVICDHARTASFLIADGVVPGNVGRNYVARMIIRRAARFGTKIGLHEPFLAKVAEAVIATYGAFYPELEKSRGAILDNLTREEIRFARTVETGTAHLENLLSELREQNAALSSSKGKTVLDGRRAFDLYATYGLPFEISRDIAREEGLEVDEAGFNAAKDEHSKASGGGKAMGKMGGEDAEFFAGILKDLQKKNKLGEHGVEYDPYTSPRVEGEVLALIVNGEPVNSASFGDPIEVILPKTGFYIESGGQVNDTGTIRALTPHPSPKNRRGEGSEGWEIEISSIRRASAGVIVHSGEVISGHPKVGDPCIAEVDMARRHDIMRNHTATHLMHAALHQVLGEHAVQAGSLVAPDRLRFDFNHPEAMTPEQIERVEKIVNAAIAVDMAVTPKLKSRADAIAEGAMALFGEKYGETVRTISIVPEESEMADESAIEHPTALVEQQPKFSYELCGGTHLERTSDIGTFIIVSEGSAAAGVRRIEAVTGRGAYELIARRLKALKQVAGMLKSSIEDVPEKVNSLQDQLAMAAKQISSLRAEMSKNEFSELIPMARGVKGTTVLAAEVEEADAEKLRLLTDEFRDFYKSGACVLVSNINGKPTIVASVTEDLIQRGLKAGDLITAIGGRGGGRPNLAQGSLPDTLNVGEALSKVVKAVEEKLK